jgi:hypothetical protein
VILHLPNTTRFLKSFCLLALLGAVCSMPLYPQTSSSTQGGATTKRPTMKGRLGRAPERMALDCRLTEKGHARV